MSTIYSEGQESPKKIIPTELQEWIDKFKNLETVNSEFYFIRK